MTGGRPGEDLNEFFAIRNLEARRLRSLLQSLHPRHRYLLADKIMSTAVEFKEDNVKLVSQLFVLAVSKELCFAASFKEG